MKYLFIVLLCCLSFWPGHSQDLQRLIAELKSSQADSLKINAYQELVNHYRYPNPDSALYYAKEGLDYSQERYYPFGEATMLNSLARINERHGSLELAKTQYEASRKIFTAIGHVRGVAATTNGLGVIAGRTGKYNDATRHFLEALERYEEIDDKRGVVQTYIKLGVVSDLLGNLDDALQYYLQAEAMNSEAPSSNASLSLLNNIGIIYGKRNDISTALKYFHRGLSASDPERGTGIYITLLGSLGIAYEKSGKPDSAIYFQEKALTIAREKNLPEEEARALVNMSSLFSQTDVDKSLELLAEALAITERIHQLNLMTEVYESMISLYRIKNDYKLALELTEKRQSLKDSLFSIQKSKEIANLHANQELARQQNEIRNLAVQNEKSIMQRNVMLVIALISVALIGIVWYFNTKVSNLNRQLIRKQSELKNSNSIKDKLFSILGHDLRAPLSRVIGLLNVMALNNQDPDETMIIEKLRQQSVNTLETLDNLLVWGQRQLKGIRLNQQTIQVKEQVNKSLHLMADYATQKAVRLVDHTARGIFVNVDPSHFDFIMRNLLSNAIKFSHSGGLVEINALPGPDEQVIISIKDSGVGIAKELQDEIFTPGNESIRGTWNEKGTGIGLMLCREYISENGGTLWVDSVAGQGARFSFSLLAKAPHPEPALEAVQA